eukprot:jgi/Ulvmu1/2609/UM014_0060.1
MPPGSAPNCYSSSHTGQMHSRCVAVPVRSHPSHPHCSEASMGRISHACRQHFCPVPATGRKVGCCSPKQAQGQCTCLQMLTPLLTVVQTARLLFKMSLLHLPLLMLFAVVHRQPNDGRCTWQSVLEQLKHGAESAEERLLAQVHGSKADGQVDSMIFPFSPPLRMPCPYTALKLSLGPRAQAADQSGADECVDREADVLGERHRRLGEAAEVS